MGRTKSMRNYKEARDYVRTLGLKDTAEWLAFATSSRRPKDIPVNPWVAYQKHFAASGEKFSINDFIGAKARRGRPRRDENRESKVKAKAVEIPKSTYEIAKDIAKSLGLKSRAEFTALSKSGQRPAGVPARPDLAFEEWEGWGEFLGNPGNTKPEKRELVLN